MSAGRQREFLRLAEQALEMLRNEAGDSPEHRAVWQETTNVLSTLNYIKGIIHEDRTLG